MLRPRDIAASAARLRATTLELLASMDDAELAAPALPDWTCADVMWHLVTSDRDTVLAKHLIHFLPSVGDDEFERGNDERVDAERGHTRDDLARGLEVWGRRLRRLIAVVPTPVARVTLPTMFGRVDLGWFATLRVYDEWVHQWDIVQALGRDGPPLDDATSDLLAEFLLRALPAKPLRSLAPSPATVAFTYSDHDTPTWRFDLDARRFGPAVGGPDSAAIETDVATFTLLAANRVTWPEVEAAGRLHIVGPDRAAAAAILDVVRVV